MKFSLAITFPAGKKAEVLESIKNLDYPKSKIEILELPGPGSPSVYRNLGLEKGKGEIIAFIDDDAVVDKNLLKSAAAFFTAYNDIDIVGGPQLTPPDDKGFARISGYTLSSKFGAWKMSNRYEGKKLNLNANGEFLTSANLFCRKKIAGKVKFDSALFPGEDPKFIEDAIKAGFKIAYSPDIIVYHRRRPTIKGFAKQIFNYGKVGPFKESFYETIKKPFFLAPSAFFIYLIAFILYSIFTGIFNPLFALPLILYLILDLAFSIDESAKNKDFLALFLLPFIFLLLHLSYGAGRLYGYSKKLVR